MVNEIESVIDMIRKTYDDFLLFLTESLQVVVNKRELKDYLSFVEEKKEWFNNYLNALNSENSVYVYGLINSVCRYFSEFNWFEDYDFYSKSQYFKSKLTEECAFIYNYFNSEDLH